MNNGRAAVSYFDRTFDEAMGLLVEARNYIATRDSVAPGETRALAQLVASCETMRLTARLTQIMAWLLVQKAVHSGEMTAADAARPEHRLGGRDICTVQDAWGEMTVPPPLQILLDRSLNLYTRIARLDEMVGRRGMAADVAQPLPVPGSPGPQPTSVD